VEDQQQIIASS